MHKHCLFNCTAHSLKKKKILDILTYIKDFILQGLLEQNYLLQSKSVLLICCVFYFCICIQAYFHCCPFLAFVKHGSTEIELTFQTLQLFLFMVFICVAFFYQLTVWPYFSSAYSLTFQLPMMVFFKSLNQYKLTMSVFLPMFGAKH